MSFFYLITSITAVIGVIYIWRRLIRYLPLPAPARWVIVALFLAASQNMLVLRKLADTSLPHELISQLGVAAGVVQAFEITLIGLCLFCDIALAALWLGKRAAVFIFPKEKAASYRVHSSARGLRQRAVTLAGLGLVVLAVGVHGAMRDPVVREQPLPIAGLPQKLSGLRIAMLADVHIGAGLDGDWLRRVVEAANARHPDAVVIVGDVADGTVERLYDEIKCLGDLKAPYGVFLVAGNHEYYSGYQEWMAAFKRMGLTVLTNEHRVLQIKGAKLVLAGVTDDTAESFDEKPLPDPAAAIAGAPADAVKILLRHRPARAEEAAALGYAAQLSGHTHGGQIIFLGPLIKLYQGYVLGLYNVNGMTLYVTPGTGVWARFPIRLGTTPEIAILKLTGK